jgi:hypothetical protein
VWVKREINLHEADRVASASTHDEVPDIRKRLSQFLAEVGMGDGDESFANSPSEFGEHRPHPIIGPKSNIFSFSISINSTLGLM